MKFIAVSVILVVFCAICMVLVVPFRGVEKKLFLNIGFPLDYKNNEFGYWLGYIFLFTQTIISVISSLFPAIVWYLMANCGLRYEVLGQQIKSMGETTNRKISRTHSDNLYHRDLLRAIQSHQSLKELTNQMELFLSNLFIFLLTTSGICICASVYNLASNRGDKMVELLIYIIFLVYTIFDTFMIMYFGNEIRLGSDRLSYSLSESNWVDRPESIKKIGLFFGAFLMRPQQLVVLKLYPLTLETFAKILNSACSMFNVLNNFK